MRKAVLLQNVARPPDAFVGNPDRLVVTTGKIGGLQKIVERLPVEATPAGTGDLVVMVPLEALQIKEREGQFLDAGLNGIVSQSVIIVFCSCMEASWLCFVFAISTFYLLWRKRARTRRFQSPEAQKGLFFHVLKCLSLLVAQLKKGFSCSSGRK